MGQRGKMVDPSQGEFLLIEGEVILGEGRLDAVVLRIIGLDHRLSWQGTSARSSRHLGQEGKGALPCPKVREVEANICQDNTDEGDVGIVVPLGNHLGSEQDVQRSSLESAEEQMMGLTAHRGVPVHPSDPGLREEASDLLFHLFCPNPELPEVRAAAHGTTIRRPLMMVTVVTPE